MAGCLGLKVGHSDGVWVVCTRAGYGCGSRCWVREIECEAWGLGWGLCDFFCVGGGQGVCALWYFLSLSISMVSLASMDRSPPDAVLWLFSAASLSPAGSTSIPPSVTADRLAPFSSSILACSRGGGLEMGSWVGIGWCVVGMRFIGGLWVCGLCEEVCG